MKFSNATTFHISTNAALRLEDLAASRPNKTPQELIAQVLEIGLYHLEYRAKRNRAQADLKRLGRQVERMVNNPKGVDPAALRALAIAMGMAEPDVDDDIVEVPENE